MTNIILGVVAGLLASIVGWLAKELADLARHRRKFGHLYSLVAGVNRIQIVVPSLAAPVFVPQGVTEAARVPKNVKVMPMAEGIAISQLVGTLHRLKKLEIQLVSQENYQDNVGLTISIGGPSLNSVSKNLLEQCFPKFAIRYPGHVASYGTTIFSPAMNEEEILTEDYGFVGVGHTSGGNRAVVLCGVWAFGTQIATTSLIRLPLHSEARRMLSRSEKFFMVSYALVDGLWPGDVQIVEIRRESVYGKRKSNELAQ